MFTGNAKTHFQVLGRDSSSSGYMMSPFGDDRWDLDDSEKLKKIYKTVEPPKMSTYRNGYGNSYGNGSGYGNNNGNVCGNNSVNGYGSSHQSVPQNCQQPMSQQSVSQTTCQPMRPPYCGYIHQSQTAQGYMPKSEVLQAYRPQPQYNRVQYQEPVYQQTEKPAFQATSYHQPVPVKHHNGLNEEEARRRSSMQNRQEPLAQNQPQVGNLCGQCQHQSNRPTDQYYLQQNWKSSPDVPLWIAGREGYRPMGPVEATPNPFYPPREKSMYIPLS